MASMGRLISALIGSLLLSSPPFIFFLLLLLLLFRFVTAHRKIDPRKAGVGREGQRVRRAQMPWRRKKERRMRQQKTKRHERLCRLSKTGVVVGFQCPRPPFLKLGPGAHLKYLSNFVRKTGCHKVALLLPKV